jgi:hypothetical protein
VTLIAATLENFFGACANFSIMILPVMIKKLTAETLVVRKNRFSQKSALASI